MARGPPPLGRPTLRQRGRPPRVLAPLAPSLRPKAESPSQSGTMQPRGPSVETPGRLLQKVRPRLMTICLCSLCAANHDIPRSLPSSHPPQAAQLARPPGHAGPDARAVGAVRTQTAFLGGRSVAPGRPARPRCAPEGRLPLMCTAPDRPAPGACAGTTPSAVCPETHDVTPLLAPARRPWPLARPLPRPSALARPSTPRPHTPR